MSASGRCGTENHQDTRTPRAPVRGDIDVLARQIVDSAFAVHSTLSPGLLESVYETCLHHELTHRDIPCQRQVHVPIVYKGMTLDAGLRLDLLVADSIVVEVKAIEDHKPVFLAQVLTYLKLTGCRLGFLINFNVPLIKTGIRRVIL